MKRTLIACVIAVGFVLFGSAAQKYTVTVQLTGAVDGTKTPQVKSFEAGKTASVSVSPAKNHYVDSWRTGQRDYIYGAGNSCSFTMPEKDVIVEANLVDEYGEAADLERLTFAVNQLDGSSDCASMDEGVLNAPQGALVRALYRPTGFDEAYSKLTVAFVGLPKGITAKAVSMTEKLAGPIPDFRNVTHPAWIIEGVASEPLDYDYAPAFATFTSQGKVVRRVRVPLNIGGVLGGPQANCRVGDVFANSIDYYVGENSWKDGWTVSKGLPSGLTFDKNTGMITGAPKKAGIYDVQCTRKVQVEKKSYSEVCVVNFRIDPALDPMGNFGSLPAKVQSIVGGIVSEDWAKFLSNGTAAKVTGLPAGLKFTDKNIHITNKGGQDEIHDAYTIYGTPTKAGNFVVTVSKKVGSTTCKQDVIWSVSPAAAPGVKDFALRDADGYWQVPSSAKYTATAVTRAGQIIDGLEQPAPDTIFGFSTSAGAKVSVNGLPSGLKLIVRSENAVTRDYVADGIATKAGNYAVTVKLVENGSSSLLRFNIEVKANPFKGDLYGYVHTVGDEPVQRGGLCLASANIGITADGILKATMKDGSKTISVTVKGYHYSFEDGRACANFSGVLPKERNTPERIFDLDVYGYHSASGIDIVDYAMGMILCDDDKEYERDISAYQKMDARCTAIAADPNEKWVTFDWSTQYPYQYSTFIMSAIGANKHGVDFAGGYVALVHKVTAGKIDFTKAIVTGRTPDGAKISATVYSICDFDWNHRRYSPVVVYNKATGRTWSISLFDGDSPWVWYYDDKSGLVQGCFDSASEDDYGSSTWQGLETAMPDFSSLLYQDEYFKGSNVFGELSCARFDPDNWEYGQISELVDEFGQLNGADIKVSFNKTTGLVTFKYGNPAETFEGVPMKPGAICGWNSYSIKKSTYNGSFTFKTK